MDSVSYGLGGHFVSVQLLDSLPPFGQLEDFGKTITKEWSVRAPSPRDHAAWQTRRGYPDASFPSAVQFGLTALTYFFVRNFAKEVIQSRTANPEYLRGP